VVVTWRRIKTLQNTTYVPYRLSKNKTNINM
jgi:hypothetical protein